jgi:non-haem Fe2+, alpha-ketoglutarate-dependent halogenase
MVSQVPSATTIEQFERDGFIGPFATYAPGEAVEKLQPIREEISRLPNPLPRGPRKKTWLPHVRNRHFDMPAVSELCSHPAILAHVSSLLGPDLVLWRSNLFVQGSDVGFGLDWHQDEYRTLLAEPRTNVSVHVAVTAATEDNCLVLLPGSNRLTRDEIREEYGLRFREGSDAGAYGSPAYESTPEVQQALAPRVKRMVLEPGEFFVFHDALLHGSNLNNPGASGEHTRIGIALRMTIPSVQVLPSAFEEVPDRGHRAIAVGEAGFEPA